MRQNQVVLYRGGKRVDPTQLRKGDSVSATVVTKQPPVTMTEQDLRAWVSVPPPEPVPRVTRVAKVEEIPATLPKTGSRLPLLGLFGLVLVAAGAGLTLVRLYLLRS